MGQVLQGGAGQAPARQAAIGAGLPKETPADTINKVCASSIRAVEIADLMIRAGEHELVVTGGMESMSNAPYLLKKARFGYRLGDGELIDLMVFDGLDLDLRRAAHGRAGLGRLPRARDLARGPGRVGATARTSAPRRRRTTGRFDDEIVPVGDLTADESVAARHVARDARAAEAGLRPGGDDHRGQRAGRQRRRLVRGRLLARSSRSAAGSSRWRRSSPRPTSRTTSPTSRGRPRGPAQLALEKAGKSIDDVKRVEINEAFSSVALNSTRMLGADEEQRERERRRGRARPSDRRVAAAGSSGR